MAAIQLAHRAGAEVFATAGSPEKRALLSALGVQHVMDSRSLSFADAVMAQTNGEGVDLVLNSLYGEAINASLDLLRPYGRFLEIGKRDIYENNKLRMRPLRKNISLHAIDLDRLCVQRPELAGSIFREVIQLFERRELQPVPYRVFSISRLAEAFRYIAQAKHVGKVVVSVSEGRPQKTVEPRDPVSIVADGTYLITGGLGGFGLALAEWLVECGARHLLLLGRSAPKPAAEAQIAALRGRGADVRVCRADITDLEDARTALEEAQASMPPIRGVVHAAMTLDDAPLRSLDEEHLWKAMAPKAAGAWNVHQLTLEAPLDFFVLFSSFTSVLGNAGQANYVAGNSFLDALAYYRRQHGLPALTINWGALSDVGYVAQHPDVARRIEAVGVRAVSAESMLEDMGMLLGTNAVQAAVADIDWSSLRRLVGARIPPRYSALAAETTDVESGAANESILRRITEAAPEARPRMLQEYLRNQLAKVLGTSPSRLDVNQSVLSVGVDSLMAVELRSRLQAEIGVNIPPAKFVEGLSIAGMAAYVAEQLALETEATAPAPAAGMAAAPAPLLPIEPADAAKLLIQIDQLTDAEVEQHLRVMTAASPAP